MRAVEPLGAKSSPKHDTLMACDNALMRRHAASALENGLLNKRKERQLVVGGVGDMAAGAVGRSVGTSYKHESSNAK